MLDINKSEENKTQKITTNGLDKKYDNDIYYYGLESVDIEINDEKIDLKEALLTDKFTMEEIIEQAEKDSKAGIIGSDMYKEGGCLKCKKKKSAKDLAEIKTQMKIKNRFGKNQDDSRGSFMQNGIK